MKKRRGKNKEKTNISLKIGEIILHLTEINDAVSWITLSLVNLWFKSRINQV